MAQHAEDNENGIKMQTTENSFPLVFFRIMLIPSPKAPLHSRR